MKTFFQILFVGVFLLGGSGRADACEQYLVDKEGKKMLKETLTLKEEQGGIAGTSVSVWVIEPTGKWTYAEFLLKQGKEVPESRQEKTGTLSQAQLTGLAKELTAHDLGGLPAKLGSQASPVNPHQYTLGFGAKKQSLLIGAAPRRGDIRKDNILDGAPTGDQPEARTRARFANIAQAIQSAAPAQNP